LTEKEKCNKITSLPQWEKQFDILLQDPKMSGLRKVPTGILPSVVKNFQMAIHGHLYGKKGQPKFKL
jgi:hypothetical protein